MHGGLLEIGVAHKFVYGSASDRETVESIVSYARAAHLKNILNMSTVGAFGGRGMGQTCGAADPSQWMRMFGIDIDSRDTTQLIQTAERISPQKNFETPTATKKTIRRRARKNYRQREINPPISRAQRTGRSREVRFLHHPIISRSGRRLRSNLFRAKHDARRWLRHLNARRSKHRAHSVSPKQAEQGTRLLRRPAAHRQGTPKK